MTPIDFPALRRLLDRNAQLVEVLPEAEYTERHLPGAVNIPSRPSAPRPPATSTPIGPSSSTAGTGFET